MSAQIPTTSRLVDRRYKQAMGVKSGDPALEAADRVARLGLTDMDDMSKQYITAHPSFCDIDHRTVSLDGKKSGWVMCVQNPRPDPDTQAKYVRVDATPAVRGSAPYRKVYADENDYKRNMVRRNNHEHVSVDQRGTEAGRALQASVYEPVYDGTGIYGCDGVSRKCVYGPNK